MIESKSCSNKTHRSVEFCVLTFVILSLIVSCPAIYAVEQYKKQGRDAVSDIVDGKYNAAIKHFQKYLSEHPNDLESMYGLAVAYAHKHEIDKAVTYVQQAVDKGLPFARFLPDAVFRKKQR